MRMRGVGAPFRPIDLRSDNFDAPPPLAIGPLTIRADILTRPMIARGYSRARSQRNSYFIEELARVRKNARTRRILPLYIYHTLQCHRMTRRCDSTRARARERRKISRWSARAAWRLRHLSVLLRRRTPWREATAMASRMR